MFNTELISFVVEVILIAFALGPQKNVDDAFAVATLKAALVFACPFVLVEGEVFVAFANRLTAKVKSTATILALEFTGLLALSLVGVEFKPIGTLANRFGAVLNTPAVATWWITLGTGSNTLLILQLKSVITSTCRSSRPVKDLFSIFTW